MGKFCDVNLAEIARARVCVCVYVCACVVCCANGVIEVI